MYYAKDFLEVYSKFSSMAISFEELQTQVKNKIDRRVRDRIAGKGKDLAQPKPPMPLPVPGPMPVAKPGNPFGGILNQNPGNLQNSNDSFSEQPSHRHSRDDQASAPRFGGSSTTPAAPTPIRLPDRPPAAPDRPQPQAHADASSGLQSRLAQAEQELRDARGQLAEAGRSREQLEAALRRLTDDCARLEKRLMAETSRADQAVRGAGLAHSGADASRGLRERVKDLETEVELMNEQNAKLLEALKAANNGPHAHGRGAPAGQGHGQHEDELLQRLQHVTRKLEMAEAENRLLRESGHRGSDPARGGFASGDAANEKLIRLESENQVLRKGNGGLPRSQ